MVAVFMMALFSSASLRAQVSFGDAVKFNDEWLFLQKDDSTAIQVSYDDSEWRKLRLPHDWSIEGQLSPSLASCTGYLPASCYFSSK